MTIPALIEPNTMQEPRQTLADVRVSRIIKVSRLRLEPKFDIYNLLNANNVLALNSRYGPVWTQPTSILAGRLFKFGMQVDF